MKSSFSAVFFITALACGSAMNTTEDLCSKKAQESSLNACIGSYCATGQERTPWSYQKCLTCFDQWCDGVGGGNCESKWCDCPGKPRENCKQATPKKWTMCLNLERSFDGGSKGTETVTTEKETTWSISQDSEEQTAVAGEIQASYGTVVGPSVSAKVSASWSQAVQSAVTQTGRTKTTDKLEVDLSKPCYVYHGQLTVEMSNGVIVQASGAQVITSKPEKDLCQNYPPSVVV